MHIKAYLKHFSLQYNTIAVQELSYILRHIMSVFILSLKYSVCSCTRTFLCFTAHYKRTFFEVYFLWGIQSVLIKSTDTGQAFFYFFSILISEKKAFYWHKIYSHFNSDWFMWCFFYKMYFRSKWRLLQFYIFVCAFKGHQY